jgi:hypothetical protein
VANGLPKTSYVKMIDIWLIFNLIVPFLEVFPYNIIFINHHLIIIRFFCKHTLSIFVVRWRTSKKSTTMEKRLKLMKQRTKPLTGLSMSRGIEGSCKFHVFLKIILVWMTCTMEQRKERGSIQKFFSVNERVQREALKSYYEQYIKKQNLFYHFILILRIVKLISQKKLNRVVHFAHVINPAIAVCFVVIYWTVGVYSYLYPGDQFEETLLNIKGIHQ